MKVRIGTIGEADTYLDGELLASGFATLAPGRHLLAFHVENVTTSPVPVGLSLTADLGPRLRASNRLPEAYPLIERWAPGHLRRGHAPASRSRARMRTR